MTRTSRPHPWAHLISWRKKAGLTQQDVASHFEVTNVTIHRWETGETPVTINNFILLAKLYGAETADHLLFDPNDNEVASYLRDAANVMEIMSPADRAKWLSIGRTLAGLSD